MRGFLLALALLAAPLAGCVAAEEITVRSPTIQPGEPISRQHTCDGPGTSPQVTFGDLPEGTETIALVVDDPDAPGSQPFVHWLVWNVPASGGSAHVPEGSAPDAAAEGVNSGGSQGYAALCPPAGDGSHTYRFTAYAVDRSLPLEEGADRSELEQALEGRTLAEGRLSGTYER